MSYILDHKLKIKSEDIIYHIHEYGIDPESNHIYLDGVEKYIGEEVDSEVGGEPGVEYAMANRFIRNLNIAMRANPDKPILIHMKTCGGHWKEGMAIYDAIKACPNPITILNYTHARSMSSLIFLAANKRVMMPNSTFMFHDGTMSYAGTAKQFLTEATELKKSGDTMVDIYVEELKKQGSMKSWSKKRIREWIIDQKDKKEDVYFDAHQAVKLGFADEVFGYPAYDWSKLIEYTDEQLER